MSKPPEFDDVSGTKTTGHEWDGIHELDTPMPRWWLITFYITIIWSVGYMILYPAVPLISDYTKGVLGYSSRAELEKAVADAKNQQADLRAKIKTASLSDIRQDPDLLNFAKAGGKAAFKVNCVQCHGSGATGTRGNPNLNDDDWLWGGSLEEIYTTIRHGIRYDLDEDTRISEMPAFGRDELLSKTEIDSVTDYVLSLSAQGDTNQDRSQNKTGAKLFKDNCASCHGEAGHGNKELGAPSLSDQIWLYGSDRSAIITSIHESRYGVMPGWGQRLDDLTIKQLTIFVHALGGGE